MPRGGVSVHSRSIAALNASHPGLGFHAYPLHLGTTSAAGRAGGPQKVLRSHCNRIGHGRRHRAAFCPRDIVLASDVVIACIWCAIVRPPCCERFSRAALEGAPVTVLRRRVSLCVSEKECYIVLQATRYSVWRAWCSWAASSSAPKTRRCEVVRERWNSPSPSCSFSRGREVFGALVRGARATLLRARA